MKEELYCCQTLGRLGVSDIADIIIATLTLFLAFYVFVYQKKQDNKSIRLQWFKELIMQPKLQSVYDFYDKIFGIKEFFSSENLSEEEKIQVINYIKRELFILRQSFVDILQLTAPALYKEIQANLDLLVDGLTISIDNDELKLNNAKTYNREIEQKIKHSYNNFFASIFNHRG